MYNVKMEEEKIYELVLFDSGVEVYAAVRPLQAYLGMSDSELALANKIIAEAEDVGHALAAVDTKSKITNLAKQFQQNGVKYEIHAIT